MLKADCMQDHVDTVQHSPMTLARSLHQTPGITQYFEPFGLSKCSTVTVSSSHLVYWWCSKEELNIIKHI
ncbi:hypothetical protein SeMB42_g00889 [Synchytrium endobioticum]|uniref:Uncharacterized protein n=1 Tax=Synchytrium endobioticum TaxID=286115 RepID=A0A507DP48_9FUNG|nr:hypothetical protein SeMB42_g00889 [Synchytrium endobioticum]